jgi:hypothetical protein
MRLIRFRSLRALAVLVAVAVSAGHASAQSTAIVFDDFNVDEGHFATSPGFSGSSTGFQKTAAETVDPDPIAPNPSTADLDTTTSADTFGTGGSQRLDIYDDLDQTTLEPNGGTARVRNLSAIGNATLTTTNVRFQTSAEDDGWIGVAVKTLDPGWTVQLWMEVSPNSVDPAYNNNGGVPKDVIADGEWHMYQWDLEDTTGGPDGWGSVSGIIAGSTFVADDFHTIDSIIFRQTDFSQVPIVDGVRKSTLWMDYVVKSATDPITLPTPPAGNADFNNDNIVDGADFLIWQKGLGLTGQSGKGTGDANGDGNVDAADLVLWQSKYGGAPSVGAASAVPEPASLALTAIALLAAAGLKRR